MSFDILMHSSHHSGRKSEVFDPFTGGTRVTAIDDPLTDEERTAVQLLLSQYGAESADECGYYTPTFDDGTSIILHFEGLVDDPKFLGGMISLRANSDAIVKFLFEIADAGNFVMIPMMEGNPEIDTKKTTADSVSGRMPDILVAQSAEDIALIISPGFEAWDRCRKRAT